MIKNLRIQSICKRQLITMVLLAMIIYPSMMWARVKIFNKKIIYTNEQIFKGIIFGRGEFALLIKEVQTPLNEKLSKLTQVQKRNLYELQDNIYNSICSKYPKFVEQFKNDVMSHDHYRIENDLTEVDKKIVEVLNVKERKFNNTFSNVAVVVDRVNTDFGGDWPFVCYVIVLSNTSGNLKTQLQREQLVNSISKI